MYAATRGPNVKWGLMCQMVGPDTFGPPVGDGPALTAVCIGRRFLTDWADYTGFEIIYHRSVSRCPCQFIEPFSQRIITFRAAYLVRMLVYIIVFTTSTWWLWKLLQPRGNFSFVTVLISYSCCNVVPLCRRGFTIRLKNFTPRATDCGGPKILWVRTIFSISVSNYICIFALVQRTFFTVLLTKDLYRRMSTIDWSEWRWAFSFYGVENWLLLHIMCGTNRLNPIFRLHEARPVRCSINM